MGFGKLGRGGGVLAKTFGFPVVPVEAAAASITWPGPTEMAQLPFRAQACSLLHLLASGGA